MKPLESSDFVVKDVFGCRRETYNVWVSVLQKNGLDSSEVDEFIETVLKPCINLREEQDPEVCMAEALKCIEAILKNDSYDEHHVSLLPNCRCILFVLIYTVEPRCEDSLPGKRTYSVTL